MVLALVAIALIVLPLIELYVIIQVGSAIGAWNTIGILILVALVLYSSPELLARFRTSRAGVGRLQAGEGEAPAA